MNLATKFAAASLLSAAFSVPAFAATVDPDGPYFNSGSCTVSDVTPVANECYGSALPEPTNAQQVDYNGATFYSGPDNTSSSTVGLFGYSDWLELAGDPDFEGDKTGSFSVGDYSMFSQIAVLLKGGPTWSAYLFEGGLGPVTLSFDLRNVLSAGLSNYLIIGRDGDTPVIPLPAAGWLLIGGIGALAAVRRKKKAA
jgi:hypothetical protein